MTLFRIRIPTALAAALTLTHGAVAHPGHGLGLDDPLHALTNLNHLAVLALAGLILCFGGRLLPSRGLRHWVQGMGVAALAAAAVLWSMHA